MANFLSNLGKMTLGGQAKSPMGGGEAMPPFLQMRSMIGGQGTQSKPVLTPKSYVSPGEAKPQTPLPQQGTTPAMASVPGAMANVAPPTTPTPPTAGGQPTPAPAPIEGQAPAKPQTMGPKAPMPVGSIPVPDWIAKQKGKDIAGMDIYGEWLKKAQKEYGKYGYTWNEEYQAFVPPNGGQGQGGVWGSPQATYDYLKGDLQNAANDRKASLASDAAARGVYYGTPLTGSYADVDTQYLKGMGALDAAMWEKSSQMQLQKLALAAQLIPGMRDGNFDPSILAILGQLYGYGGGPQVPGK